MVNVVRRNTTDNAAAMEKPNHEDDRFSNTRVVVMGLGRFGGGVGLTRWLIESGAIVVVSDSSDRESLADSLEQLADLMDTGRLEFVHGQHEPTLLDEAQMFVVNPAVPMPWANPFILEAQSRGITITTEIEIAYRQLDPTRIVAVTGSAGKSTTSAMIHQILSSIGADSVLGGNIGGSLLTLLDKIDNKTIVVLELSSAMLYWLWGREQSGESLIYPAVGCITNCSPNHLDWHGDESHYRLSKQQLLRAMGKTSTAILGESLRDWSAMTNARVEIIEEDDAIDGCQVPGIHNAINAAMAVRAAEAITGCSADSISEMEQAVRSFPGLPHRLFRCHEHDSVVYFDDSKSTVPQATCLAVDAVSEQVPKSVIHLIVGGYNKGSDLSSIAALADQLAGLYCIGDTGAALAKQAGENGMDCATLENAMECIRSRVKPGDAVLLSPGCASWDQFPNYEARGDRFEQLVKAHTRSAPCSSN
jgi:UDP-N-acetylmuramoylalanine--D-glutamate ligase